MARAQALLRLVAALGLLALARAGARPAQFLSEGAPAGPAAEVRWRCWLPVGRGAVMRADLGAGTAPCQHAARVRRRRHPQRLPAA